MTESPSQATESSVNSMPASVHSWISPSRMGREALERSVSPLQNRSNPPPEPETPTVTRTSGLAIWNSSATASAMGKTVLDPSIWTLPVRASPPSRASPPQAARRKTVAPAVPMREGIRFMALSLMVGDLEKAPNPRTKRRRPGHDTVTGM